MVANFDNVITLLSHIDWLARQRLARTVRAVSWRKIQQKIALAKPGDTVLVSGTCSENVAIPSEVVRITLDGQGKALIQAPGTTADAIFIRGKDITVKGFTPTRGTLRCFHFVSTVTWNELHSAGMKQAER